MAFSSEAALKAALAKAATKAVMQVEKEVYGTFKNKLSQYYGEFTPAEYIRTSELRSSLQTTGVSSSGNGAKAEVYFDTPSYWQGMVPIQSTPITGEYGWATWSGEKVLETAMNGSHGGYKSGTPIWGESLSELGDIKGKLYSAFKAAL